jgi:hypothetical protein
MALASKGRRLGQFSTCVAEQPSPAELAALPICDESWDRPTSKCHDDRLKQRATNDDNRHALK